MSRQAIAGRLKRQTDKWVKEPRKAKGLFSQSPSALELPPGLQEIVGLSCIGVKEVAVVSIARRACGG
jgi:hypothetical protein